MSLVIRRVGGLEVVKLDLRFEVFVIRRVGGLEEPDFREELHLLVIRRVGGLEVQPRLPYRGF